MADFKSGAGKIEDQSVKCQKVKRCQNTKGDRVCQRDTGANLKHLPSAQAGTI